MAEEGETRNIFARKNRTSNFSYTTTKRRCQGYAVGMGIPVKQCFPLDFCRLTAPLYNLCTRIIC